MDKDDAAAFWAEAHTDAGRPDPETELAELEAMVYSRAGSAESVVDFIDPVTGETVRATPSQLRLRALRAKRAQQTSELDARHRARLPDTASAGAESLAIPALAPDRTGPARRRFVLPLVAAAAFAAGIVTVLIVSSALAPIYVPGTPDASATSAPLLIFDSPTLYPDIPVPDLGGQFVADSIRNISGTSPATHGFGVFLGRETGSGLYCLIVQNDADALVAGASSCANVDDVAQQGLTVWAAVTVRSAVTPDGTLGDNEVTANLTPGGDFSMTLSRTEKRSVAPPETTGTTLGTWTSESANGDFQGDLDAHGEGLLIALDCVGHGTVTVDLSDGMTSQFECMSTSVESLQNGINIAQGTFTVTVFTQGDVTWGLTIASTPVTDAAQEG